jgi:O-antigen ligase
VREVNSEAGKSGSAAPIALGITLGAVLVLRVLWSGVTYPESNVVILFILAILLAASLYISALTGGITWRVTRTDAFVLLYFLVVLLLSICSGRQWLARDFLFQTAGCTAAYFLAVNLGSSRPARIALAAGLVSGAILVSLYGLYQYFCGLSETRALLSGAMIAGDQSSAFVSRVSSNAIFSTFFYPNALAGYLIIAIPFVASILFWPLADSLAACYGTYLAVLLAASVAWGFFSDLSARPLLLVCLFAAASTVLSGLAIAEKKGSRLLLNLCALPLVILPLWALSLTASEGAWLALLFSVLFTPLLLRGRYRIASAIGLVVLALVVVAVLADMVPAGMKDSAGARVDYWRAALGMWRENPVRGLGPGGFAGAYARFRAPGSEEGRMPHSIYLGLASEMGAIGLAAFICLWISCIRALIKSQILPRLRSGQAHPESQSNCSCDQARAEKAIPFAVTISICAFLVHGAIDVNLSVPETSLTLWALAGLGVGASTAHSRARRLPALSGVLLGFLVLGAAIFWIGPHAGAEWHRLRSQELETRGMRDRAGEEVHKALSLEGDNPVYWNSLAEILERAGNVGGALAAYRQAAVRGEGIPAYHFRLAACYWRHAGGGSDRGKAAAAMDELRKAIACNPHDVDYHLLLAYWLETTGRPAEALGEYRHGLGLIHAAREKPKRIRRHSPAEYERLDAMVRERVAELDHSSAVAH